MSAPAWAIQYSSGYVKLDTHWRRTWVPRSHRCYCWKWWSSESYFWNLPLHLIHPEASDCWVSTAEMVWTHTCSSETEVVECVYMYLCRTTVFTEHILVAVEILIESRCVTFLLLFCVSILLSRKAILGLEIRVIILALLIGWIYRDRLWGGFSQRYTQSWSRVLESNVSWGVNLNKFFLFLQKEHKKTPDT